MLPNGFADPYGTLVLSMGYQGKRALRMPDQPKPERRKAKRQDFVASVSLANVNDAKPVSGEVQNLSFSGCYISTPQTLAVWNEVRLEVAHQGQTLSAVGMVSHSDGKGMGILFLRIPPQQEALLREWLASSSETIAEG